MNAANEIAVEYFLNSKIEFLDIPLIIEKAMQTSSFIANPSIEDYFQTDKEVKQRLRLDYSHH